MRTTNYKMGDLLRRAKDGTLTIPQFQRRFIWSHSQVALLIDSISRDYPIGSLLLLDHEPTLPLRSRSIEAEIKAGFPPEDVVLGDDSASTDGESYILDGQQRTTSIARVFLNAHPRRVYYFDLKNLLELHAKEETSWIKTRHRRVKPEHTVDKGRLLRADIILDQKMTDVFVTTYIEDSGDYPDTENSRLERREFAAYIKGVFETIRNYHIPVVTLERKSGIESICRVFETINSTGTRLTTFDLAVARFFPKPDLRAWWEESLSEHEILKRFDVDGESVLQVLFLTTAARSKRYADPTRGNLLTLASKDIEREWKRSTGSLAATYKWVRAFGARPKTLPNHNILIALAAIRSLILEDVTDELWDDNDYIRRWYFSKVLQAGASQASNYRIGQQFNTLRKYAENDEPLDVSEVQLNRDDLLKLRPSDVRYRALLNVFATTIRQDLTTGNNIDSESDLHDHHIFPRVAAKNDNLPRQMLDSICNRVPILAASNLHLGETYPHDYFHQMADRARKQSTLGGMSARIRDCMIPGDPQDPQWVDIFSLKNFKTFCERRADLILSRVREIIGDSLRTTSTHEQEFSDD